MMSLSKSIRQKAFLLSFCGAAALMVIGGCSDQLKKTGSGLEYKIIDNESGAAAKVGDYMKVHIKTIVHDSVIMDTHKSGVGYRWLQLQKPAGDRFDMMEGLALLSKGDSAEFIIPTDSVMNAMNRPPFVKAGDKMHVYVKVVDIKDEQSYSSTLEEEKKEQADKDAQIIKAYLDSTQQKGIPAENGVYVVIHQEGSGVYPQDGQEVTVMYTGKTLDGQVFDSNEDSAFHHTQPLTFMLGRHMMIPGMEDGVKILKKGADATLVIPSGEAYGPQGREPAIKPNSVLLFDVKVTDITGKATPASPQQK
jgi:FKBP-type peptidyl-prolyl cis-trans isomerase